MPRSGEGTTPAAGGEGRVTSLPEWLTVLLTFVLVLAPLAAWALAVPPYGSPDEADHVRYAVAVVSGTPVVAVPTDEPWSQDVAEQLANRGVFERVELAAGWGITEIPAFYAQDTWACFAFQRDATADCQVFQPLTGTKEALTSARLYPKPYYAVVGVPSLFADDLWTLYAMRLVSGTLTALCLTFAITVARRRRRPLLLGIAVAATPMLWFMGSVVNPNGTEIALALAWWIGLLALVDGAARAPTARQPAVPPIGFLVGLGAIGVGLAVVRPLSLLWLALITLVVVIDAGWARVRELVTTRSVLAMTGVVVVAGAVQALLVLGGGSLGATDPRTDVQGLTLTETIRTSIGRQADVLHQMIGTFGWLDTRIPSIVVTAWLVTVGVLAGLALLTGARRRLFVLGGWIAAVVVLPVVLEVQGVDAVGFIWQGRYSLPLAVGVPILAARAVDWSRLGGLVGQYRRVASLVTGVTAVGAAVGFYQTLRRFSVGVTGPIQVWDRPRWEPPASAWAIATFGIGAHLVLGWWLYRLAVREPAARVSEVSTLPVDLDAGDPVLEPVPQVDQRM